MSTWAPSWLTKLHIAQLPKLLMERRSTAVFGVVIITMLWAATTFKYIEGIESDQREAERTNQNFAMVFEENVLRTIGEIDKALLYLRRSIETRRDSADFGTIVNTTDVLSEIIVQVAIIDSHGIMRASNVGPQPSPPVDLSDREHFRAHLHTSKDELFISKPVIGRVSGKWSVQFTRRFSNKDKSFGGVVVASLDPAHLTEFYDKIDFGTSASMALIGSDGVVRSSGGSADGYTLGQDLTGTPLLKFIQAGSNATFEAPTHPGGSLRLITVRKVRDQPLWVAVGINKRDIFQRSASNLKLHAATAFVLTLLVLAAMEQILRTEAKARQKAAQLHLTLEHMSQGIMLVTKDLEIPVINSRCAELLELPPELIDKPPRFDELVQYHIEHPNNGLATDVLNNAQRGSAVDNQNGRLTVCERKMPNGLVLEVRSGRLPDGSFVQTFADITKRHEAEAHVARLASEDPLTGLPNRRVFSNALEQISRNQQQTRGPDEAPREFAVLFLDLDRFKFINDTLGHRIGDLLLQGVAQRLKHALADLGLLARLGGDEFAIVVPSVESRSALQVLATRLAKSVTEPYSLDGHQVRSSVSIGIAVGPSDGESVDDLLMAADLALYAVKASSRGTYDFYRRSMNRELNERRQIEIDLREAIERNELELYYQPVVNLRRNRVSGFEALARWRHPTKGMIPPNLFIPVAEDSGLILPLGEWALAEACRQAVTWPEHLSIAVNISPVQLSAANFFDSIVRILAETGLAPHRLELEITERIFMEDSLDTLSILHRLKTLGVRIAMDDFGTGYSSLSYLRSFPFDKIKIDRAFVSDLADGTEHIVIVQAVVSIARALGMTTTAEGVETFEQQEFLRTLGCDQVQGYLCGKPVPIDQVFSVISQWTPGTGIAA